MNSKTANFLKFSIREVDGKKKLFDEHDQYVTDVSNRNIVLTVWSIITINDFSDGGQHLFFLRDDVDRFWEAVPTAVEFEENGRKGWKTPSGDLILPAIFKFMEVKDEYFFGHDDYYKIYINKNGGIRCVESLDNSTFYENGKCGLLNPDGTILFPAIYDRIYRWSEDSDVFYTRIGDEFHYYNSNHEEILTTYRKFDGVDDKSNPYYIGEEQSRETLVTMQLTDDLSDPQSCVCFGQKVKLDRLLKSEVIDIIKNHCEVWNKGIAFIDEFNSEFTYIYSAYYAQSKSVTPIEDCLSQFEKMECFVSSWHFMVKVLTNSNTAIPKTEMSKLVWYFQDKNEEGTPFDFHTELTPMDFVTIGYDDTLKAGEVKMFIVRFFADRWPNELDNIYNDAFSGSVENYNEKIALLKQTLEEERETYKWDDYVYQSFYNWFLNGSNSFDSDYRYFDSKSEKPLLDYLAKHEGYSAKHTVWKICDAVNMLIDYDEPQYIERAYQKIKSMLNYDAYLTLVGKKQSCLDLITDSIAKTEAQPDARGKKTKLASLRKIERLLLKHGAKTASVIRSKDFDPYNM